MDKQRKQGIKRKSHWKRAMAYTGLGLAALVIALGSVGLYEYHRLQPQNHFKNLPSVGLTSSNPSSSSTTTSKQSSQSESQPAGSFNVILFGSDARPSGGNISLSDAESHTDSIMLVHVNLKTHQYNVLSIPRDTRVYMPGFGNTKLTSVQLLAQSQQGPQKGTVYAVQLISNLVGVPINYYAETNYWGLQAMVNSLGGITMDLPFPVTLTHAWYPQDEGLHFTAGPHFLNGKLVTEVVHERYSVPGTDYGRQQLQVAALKGIAKSVMSPRNATKLPSLSKSLSQYLMDTNMSTQDVISLAIGIKGNFSEQQIHYYQVNGTSEVLYNDALKANDDEVVINTNQLHQIIQDHFTN